MNYNEKEILIKITDNLKAHPICAIFEKTGKDVSVQKGKSPFQFDSSGLTFEKIKQNLSLNKYKRRKDWEHDIFKLLRPVAVSEKSQLNQNDANFIDIIVDEARRLYNKEIRYFGEISESKWAKTLSEQKDKLQSTITKQQTVKKPRVPFITCKEIKEVEESVKEVPPNVIHKIYEIIQSEEPEKQYNESVDNTIDLATLKTSTLIQIRSTIKKWYKKNNKPFPPRK